MPGRVLRSGCVQVVQNMHIIPGVLHPRCRLTEAAAAAVGEVVYVPVYDLHAPAAGPVAVLEALLSSRASDSMLVASFISAAGHALEAAQVRMHGVSWCLWGVARACAHGMQGNARAMWLRQHTRLRHVSPPTAALPPPPVGSGTNSWTNLASACLADPPTLGTCSLACRVVCVHALALRLQLSLSNPLPQPVRRSRLEGRKPRPVHDDSDPDLCAHQQQQPASFAGPGNIAGRAPAEAAAARCSPMPAVGPFSAPDQQQLQQCSPSSASAGTVVAGSAATGGAVGASSPCATATDSTLTSTLSSRPGEVPAAMPAELCCQSGSMLPPRPHPAAAGRQQPHRRSRDDSSTPAAAAGPYGDDDDDDGDASPPYKLQRTLSMSRTKSVSGGLDLVLAAAVAACCEHAAAC